MEKPGIALFVVATLTFVYWVAAAWRSRDSDPRKPRDTAGGDRAAGDWWQSRIARARRLHQRN